MSSDSGQTTAVRTIGRYRVFDELGRGAMGVVYRGFDPVIGRTVALKTLIIDTGDAQAREFRDRLYREAAAAGALSHPNIVTIFDIIEDGAVTAVAMEFIEGRSLAAIISERAPLPLDLAIEIFDQICSALDYAGSHGIVHRDIKPANILMTAAGRAKVTDFGVARLALSTMTQAGTVLGSPSYMSPEQVRGLPLDGRSDLFSAAVVFFEMITRERPFAGNDIATTMYRIAHESPTPPGRFNAAIGPAVTAVLDRAFAKNPDERFRTGAEFVSELRRATSLSGSAAGASPALSALAAAPPPPVPLIVTPAAPVAPPPVAMLPTPATTLAPDAAVPPVVRPALPILASGETVAVRSDASLPPIPGGTPGQASSPGVSPDPKLALPVLPSVDERPTMADRPKVQKPARRAGNARMLALAGGAAALVIVGAAAVLYFGTSRVIQPTVTPADPLVASDAVPLPPPAPPASTVPLPTAAPMPMTPPTAAPAKAAATAAPVQRPRPATAAKPVVTPPPPAPVPAPDSRPDTPERRLPVGRIYNPTEVDSRAEPRQQVPPSYPAGAAARKVEDVVVLKVLVGPTGRAEDVQVLRGSLKDPAFDAAAMAAVRQWTFTPARKSGQPVASWYNVGVPFQLPK